MEPPQGRDVVLLLLEKYCNLRSPPRRIFYEGPDGPPTASPPKQSLVSFRTLKRLQTDSARQSESKEEDVRESKVPERLAKIAESAPIAEQNLQTQDEIIQGLVELLMTFGDDINVKLQQNPALKQQLENFNYNLFKKLTSSVQNLVAPSGRAASSDGPVQQQRIAWAFEVTSRLSAVTVVQRRMVLHFGAQYIKENHAGWVQHHGGWEEAFD